MDRVSQILNVWVLAENQPLELSMYTPHLSEMLNPAVSHGIFGAAQPSESIAFL